MRRGVAPVVGGRITAVRRPRCSRRPIRIEPAAAALRRRAVGRRIDDVGRVGKRVFLLLEGGDRLVFEPRMTGLVLLADPPTREHLRLRVELAEAPAPELLYWDRRGLGSVRLLDEAGFQAWCGPPRLGPDALRVTAAELEARLGASARKVKVALLDQSAVAGVGNIYASEALHRARVHPARPCRDLDRREWRALHRALRRTLEEAIRYEGSTLNDGTYRTALNQDGRYQSAHRVYARTGERCRTCRRADVERVVMGQRATFFCPRCQA